MQDEDEGVLLIFAIGASTLLDFPNPAQTSFPNFLQLMLEDAYPGREIEVINCGITAIILMYCSTSPKRSPRKSRIWC